MLQPHMNKIRIKVYGAQMYTAWLYEIKEVNAIHAALTRIVSDHTVQITMRYARIDSVRCLNGQYMAKHLSPDIAAAEFNVPTIGTLSIIAEK